MTLQSALLTLCDVHTRDDEQIGFVIMAGATPPPYLREGQYVEAWEVIREAALRPVEASPLPGDVQDALRVARSYSICGQLDEEDEAPQPGTVSHERRIACELAEALLWFAAAHPTKAESQDDSFGASVVTHPLHVESERLKNRNAELCVQIAALQEKVLAYEEALAGLWNECMANCQEAGRLCIGGEVQDKVRPLLAAHRAKGQQLGEGE